MTQGTLQKYCADEQIPGGSDHALQTFVSLTYGPGRDLINTRIC